jgi:selenocysteine lyase/cysteine desulfurase
MGVAAAAGGIAGLFRPNLGWAASQGAEAGLAGKITAADDWAEVRKHFMFQPGLTYLNNGTEGSMPAFIQSRMVELMQRWASSPTYAFLGEPFLERKQEKNRGVAGAFVGASAQDVALTNNTTMGLGTVWNGLDLGKGDVVMTTTHDHGATLGPLMALHARRGVEVYKVALPTPTGSAEEILGLFEQKCAEIEKEKGPGALKAVGFSHINYTTGLRMPVKALSAWARGHEVASVVDGAHGPGTLALDMADLGCDFYAGAGHKWLNGPPGTGILYIRDSVENPYGVYPVLFEAADEETFNEPVIELIQRRGCNNGPSLTALTDMMRFLMDLGTDRVQARVLELSRLVALRTLALWGAEALYSPVPEAEDIRSGINVIVPGKDPEKRFDGDYMEAVVNRLREEYNIWVRTIQVPNTAPGDPEKVATLIRVSTNIFNTELQVDKLFWALQKIGSSTT